MSFNNVSNDSETLKNNNTKLKKICYNIVFSEILLVVQLFKYHYFHHVSYRHEHESPTVTNAAIKKLTNRTLSLSNILHQQTIYYNLKKLQLQLEKMMFQSENVLIHHLMEIPPLPLQTAFNYEHKPTNKRVVTSSNNNFSDNNGSPTKNINPSTKRTDSQPQRILRSRDKGRSVPEKNDSQPPWKLRSMDKGRSAPEKKTIKDGRGDLTIQLFEEIYILLF